MSPMFQHYTIVLSLIGGFIALMVVLNLLEKRYQKRTEKLAQRVERRRARNWLNNEV